MGKAYARIVSFCYLRLPYPPPPRFDIELAFESSAQALPGALAATTKDRVQTDEKRDFYINI